MMLRTDLFKTVDRAETRFIAVRDALFRPDTHVDVRTMDAIHCKQGRLGVGWHFFVLASGTIQLGRDIETCGSHSKGLDNVSVAVGVEGGTDEEGNRAMTRTADQLEAINDLIEFLQARYPHATLSDTPNPDYPTP